MDSSSKNKRGTVGIEQRDGKWRLRLPRAVAEGSARYISTRLDATEENYRKAQVKAWEIEEDIRLERFDTTLSRYTFSPKPVLTVLKPPVVEPDLDELWTRYCAYREPQVAVTTFRQSYLERYPRHIAKLPSKKLSDAVLIRDWLLANSTPYSARLLLTQLSACCRWAAKNKLIEVNPFVDMAEEVKVHKPGWEDIDPFSREERDAILNAYAEHRKYKYYYPYFRFLFLTGCRTGEACALQWRHVSKDCGVITFAETWSSRLKLRKDTKTHTIRRFPCNAVLRELLLGLREEVHNGASPDEPVFTTRVHHKVIDNNTVTYNLGWRTVVKGLVSDGLVERYRPSYNTRHTFITMALEGGVTVPQVAKLVGNSPHVILENYAGSLLKFEVPVT